MPSSPDRSSDAKLLEGVYRKFVILSLAFLLLGVPLVAEHKTACALLCLAVIGMVVLPWLIYLRGRMALSLQIFSVFSWLGLVVLIFFGAPPMTAAIAMAFAIMLAMVVGMRPAALFAGTYMIAWLFYLVLRQADRLPPPYFTDQPIVSWSIAAGALWLVLSPIAGMVRHLRRAIALKRSAIEATGDGILVIARDGKVSLYNQRFAEMWRIPPLVLASKCDELLLDAVRAQLQDPAQFLERVQYLEQNPRISALDILRLKDGRVYERNALPQRLDAQVVGRVWSFRDITENQQTEDALRRSQQLLDSIVENIPAMVFVKHAIDLRFALFNRAGEQLLGYSRSDFLGKNDYDFFSKEEADAFTAEDRKVLASVQAREIPQEAITTANGETRYLRTWKIALRDTAGEASHLLGISLDLTDRKLAEEKLSEANLRLEESERLIRAVTDNLPALVAYWDAELRCRFANQPYLAWFDKTAEEMLGMRLEDLLGASLYAREESYLRRALQGERQNFERTLTRRSGAIGYTWANYIPDVDADGNVAGIFVLISDVTQLKQAEEAQRIAAAAFDSQEAMLITDAHMVILRVNRAFTEATGYAAEDVVGQTPRVLQSGRHDAAFYASMWESIGRCGFWQGEIWDRRKNGEIYPNWMTITAVKDGDGSVTHYVGTQTDITGRKAAEDEIRHLAFFDALTGLPNRRLLMDRLRQTLAASVRNGRQGALMFIDLDHFKTLNDTLGHDKGDLLLRQVAERLSGCVRVGDTVARFGGDEFVVMLEELDFDPQQAAIQAKSAGEKMLAALHQPYNLAGHKYHCTPSIGVALFVDHDNTIEEIMKRADMAMYQAKSAGRDCLRFFDPEMQAVVTAHATLKEELHKALERGEFLLHYQAQVDNTGRLVGAEALVRWLHPQRGMILPDAFIPLSEKTAIILPLGIWVLQTACAQLVAWSQQPDRSDLTLAVNVSARQFRQSTFVEQVVEVLEQSGANPQRLKLELTESLLLDDVEDVIAKMTALKAHGVALSLDDFGTGYSALCYLKRLPLGQLKIDRSFVRDVLTNANDAAIVRAIVALGLNLGLEVVAEGIESEAQWRFFKDLGCHSYQGYFFGYPIPLQEFEQ